MKNILVPMLIAAAAIGGAVGGQIFKAGASADGGTHDVHNDKSKNKKKTDNHGSKDEGHGKEDKGHGKDMGHGKAKSSDGNGGGHGDAVSTSDVAYYKFSREFVVPLMNKERVRSLVILHINLEVDSEISSSLFSLEPKLRDNIMTTLIGLSNDGTTLEEITRVESYETIRSMVLMNLDKVVASGVRNVLILDIGKQDI